MRSKLKNDTKGEKREYLIPTVVLAFSSRARIWGECSTIYSPPAFLFFIFLKSRLARAHYFHSFGKDRSTVAQRAETTETECSLMSCVWARFRIGSPTMPQAYYMRRYSPSGVAKLYNHQSSALRLHASTEQSHLWGITRSYKIYIITLQKYTDTFAQ